MSLTRHLITISGEKKQRCGTNKKSGDMKKICWFVDDTDGHKDFICVFNDSEDKEKIAEAINKEIESMGFLDSYEDPEGVLEIGRSLAYNNYALYGEYEFTIENVKEFKI